jgi:N-acetylmuramoyl-L-alanine amidase
MHIISHPSPNFNERMRPLEYIVLHYTDQMGVHETLDILVDPIRQVSSHYVVDYDGSIYQLVDDEKRAWHAGKSLWHGIDDMNSASIGIEIENPGHSHGYKEFTSEQIDAVIALCNHLVQKHGLDPKNVIGHSDVAPLRKEDPGHLFPWRQLYASGLGMWPRAVDGGTMTVPEAETALAKIGYDVSEFGAALTAFQRHFVPNDMGQGLTSATIKALRGLM